MKDIKKQIATLFDLTRARHWHPMWTHYYRRDPKGNRVLAATSCILLTKDLRPVSRGLCSVYIKANGQKAYGRLESLKRAFRTVMTGVEGVVVEGRTMMRISIRGIEGLTFPSSHTAKNFGSGVDWLYYTTEVEEDRINSRIEREKQNSNKTEEPKKMLA